MPITIKRPIQDWAQKKRLQFFKEHFRVGSKVLEVGSGSGWLKPGGKMLITTPLPQTDWILKITESFGLNQKRTSPHDYLIDLRTVSIFPYKKISIIFGLGQWAVMQKG